MPVAVMIVPGKVFEPTMRTVLPWMEQRLSPVQRMPLRTCAALVVPLVTVTVLEIDGWQSPETRTPSIDSEGDARTLTDVPTVRELPAQSTMAIPGPGPASATT